MNHPDLAEALNAVCWHVEAVQMTVDLLVKGEDARTVSGLKNARSMLGAANTIIKRVRDQLAAEAAPDGVG